MRHTGRVQSNEQPDACWAKDHAANGATGEREVNVYTSVVSSVRTAGKSNHRPTLRDPRQPSDRLGTAGDVRLAGLPD